MSTNSVAVAAGSFVDEFAAVSAGGGSPHDLAAKQFGVLQKWLFTNRTGMFEELRRRAPIFVPEGAAPAIISRFTDVVEVAKLDGVFSVAPYSGAMKRDNGGPNFILGMDNGAEYEFNVSVLRLAIQRTDIARIQKWAAGRAQEIVAAAIPAGRLELVESYARRIPLELCGYYFGVPGPDLAVLSQWTHYIFTDIFFNFTQDPAVIAAGTRAGKALADYVDELIRRIKSGAGAPEVGDDTVLRRLLAMQCDPKSSCTDLGVRVNMTGCINGIVDNICPAVVNIVDYLLANPAALASTAAAARGGDDEVFRQHVFEAFRFGPAAPFLVRVAVEDHVLAKDTERAARIPAGKIVLAATCSAMLDESVVDDPMAFNPKRPSYQNLQFGFGLHACIGRYVAEALIVEMVRALVLQGALRRAEGAAGQPVRHGPFPASFTVALA